SRIIRMFRDRLQIAFAIVEIATLESTFSNEKLRFVSSLSVANTFGKFTRAMCRRQSLGMAIRCDQGSGQRAQGLALVPLISDFASHSDGLLQMLARFGKITAQQFELSERIEGHRNVLFALIRSAEQAEGTLECFFGAIPLPGNHQICAEIVMRHRREHRVFSGLVIVDRAFEIANAFLRPLEEVADAGHVRVDLAKEESRRVIAD